jgi:hypothetical protein
MNASIVLNLFFAIGRSVCHIPIMGKKFLSDTVSVRLDTRYWAINAPLLKLSGVWGIVFVSLMIVLFPPEGFLRAKSYAGIDHRISVGMNE